MPTFLFDPNLSYEANLAAFFAHMRTVDAELGPLLEAHAATIPLLAADDSRVGRNDRAGFNAKISSALDSLTEGLPKDAPRT